MAIDAERVATRGSDEAWTQDGELLYIMEYVGCRCKAYRPDVWHNFELGVGKDFIGSAGVLCLDIVPGGSAKRSHTRGPS